MAKLAENASAVIKAYPRTKQRVVRLALRMSDREQRRVSEAELYDRFAKECLPMFERKYDLS